MGIDARLPYEDSCPLANDEKRYEIMTGELFVTPSPLRLHQKAIGNLFRYVE